MENKRPTLYDPAEWATIREIYFDNSRPLNDEIEPIERLERMEAKQKNNNKSSR